MGIENLHKYLQQYITENPIDLSKIESKICYIDCTSKIYSYFFNQCRREHNKNILKEDLDIYQLIETILDKLASNLAQQILINIYYTKYILVFDYNFIEHLKKFNLDPTLIDFYQTETEDTQYNKKEQISSIPLIPNSINIYETQLNDIIEVVRTASEIRWSYWNYETKKMTNYVSVYYLVEKLFNDYTNKYHSNIIADLRLIYNETQFKTICSKHDFKIDCYDIHEYKLNSDSHIDEELENQNKIDEELCNKDQTTIQIESISKNNVDIKKDIIDKLQYKLNLIYDEERLNEIATYVKMKKIINFNFQSYLIHRGIKRFGSKHKKGTSIDDVKKDYLSENVDDETFSEHFIKNYFDIQPQMIVALIPNLVDRINQILERNDCNKDIEYLGCEEEADYVIYHHIKKYGYDKQCPTIVTNDTDLLLILHDIDCIIKIKQKNFKKRNCIQKSSETDYKTYYKPPHLTQKYKTGHCLNQNYNQQFESYHKEFSKESLNNNSKGYLKDYPKDSPKTYFKDSLETSSQNQQKISSQNQQKISFQTYSKEFSKFGVGNVNKFSGKSSYGDEYKNSFHTLDKLIIYPKQFWAWLTQKETNSYKNLVTLCARLGTTYNHVKTKFKISSLEEIRSKFSSTIYEDTIEELKEELTKGEDRKKMHGILQLFSTIELYLQLPLLEESLHQIKSVRKLDAERIEQRYYDIFTQLLLKK